MRASRWYVLVSPPLLNLLLQHDADMGPAVQLGATAHRALLLARAGHDPQRQAPLTTRVSAVQSDGVVQQGAAYGALVRVGEVLGVGQVGETTISKRSTKSEAMSESTSQNTPAPSKPTSVNGVGNPHLCNYCTNIGPVPEKRGSAGSDKQREA